MIQNVAQKDKGRENVSEIKLRNKELSSLPSI